jgi:hypothetical protein
MGHRWGQSQPGCIHSQTPFWDTGVGWVAPAPPPTGGEAGSFPSPLHTPSTPTRAWWSMVRGKVPPQHSLGGGVASPSPPCPLPFGLGPAQVVSVRSCFATTWPTPWSVLVGGASPFPSGVGRAPLALQPSHTTALLALGARRPSLHGSPSTTAIRQEPDSRGTGTRWESASASRAALVVGFG